MAESSSGQEDITRRFAEASAILGAAGDRRTSLGSSRVAQIQTLERIVSRLHPQAARPGVTSPTRPDSQDVSDQGLWRRLQAQRVALTLLSKSIPVPQQLLAAVGPSSTTASQELLQVGSSRKLLSVL